MTIFNNEAPKRRKLAPSKVDFILLKIEENTLGPTVVLIDQGDDY